MGNELVKHEGDVPAIADDQLLIIAERAEQRVAAINKIKQIALAITNGGDWVDQNGKPYLMASGAEKIAALFNIGWEFLTTDPVYEEDPDGHYTFTYKGRFSLGTRRIDIDGSRSSKDGFFKQYNGYGDTRTEKTVQERDNKRDVKMAALTNCLGNGITRILGIRNLTYADIEQFAGITKDMIGKVEYKSDKPPLKAPQEKGTATKGDISPAQVGKIQGCLKDLGITDDLEKHVKVSEIIKAPETIASFSELSKKQASTVIEALIAEKGTGKEPF